MEKETRIRPTWDEYFMLLAKLAATRSTCLSRPTGAVIVLNKQVLSTGYNGSMPGATHCLEEGECYRRSIKVADDEKYDYCRSSHAEANALTQAAKKGIPVEGATVYCTLLPCYTCTKLIAGAGIRKVVFEHGYTSANPLRDSHWEKAISEGSIEVEKLVIPEKTKKLAKDFIERITSERLLQSE